MKMHPAIEASIEFERGRECLAAGRTLAALVHLEASLALDDSPSAWSYLGYCIAKERGHVTRGIELCAASLAAEPGVPAHYHNLGRIHLLAGNKWEALRVFRDGISRGEHDGIRELLKRIGTRRPPVLPFLSRDHIINHCLGLLLSRLRLR